MKHENPDLAVAFRAKTLFEAQVVAGVLESAGIPAQVSGRGALVWFSLFKRRRDEPPVKVEVPAHLLEEAQRAIKEAREAGEGE